MEPGTRDTVPFAPGSVSSRVYPHNELTAGEIAQQPCPQAAIPPVPAGDREG